jgi:hypothetical protein
MIDELQHLTLEQLQELRRKLDCGCAECAPRDALWEHREDLLDAAERVARQQAYANQPDGYDTPEHVAGHWGPVGTEPHRCNWTNDRGRCSLPHPHEGPHLPEPAAERTARDAEETAPFPHVWPPPEMAEHHKVAWETFERIQRARHDRILGIDPAARARLAELEPEARLAFADRPAVLELGLNVTNPKALTLAEIQAWYAARGLLVHLKLMGDQLMYDFVGLIETPTTTSVQRAPRCDCGLCRTCQSRPGRRHA